MDQLLERQLHEMPQEEHAGLDEQTVLVCVVEQPRDLMALERAGTFRGVYHVLLGRLSPLQGVGPDQLTIEALAARVRSGTVREVILATNPNLEGDATALYLVRLLADVDITVTRLASGLPVGGDLEYADEVTLGRAFEGRRLMFEPTA